MKPGSMLPLKMLDQPTRIKSYLLVPDDKQNCEVSPSSLFLCAVVTMCVLPYLSRRRCTEICSLRSAHAPFNVGVAAYCSTAICALTLDTRPAVVDTAQRYAAPPSGHCVRSIQYWAGVVARPVSVQCWASV